MNKYLECGTITNTHGIDGAVKSLSWCNSPEVLASFPAVYTEQLGVYRKLSVKSASVYKNMVIFTFDEVDSVEKATKLKGRTIYADREDFNLQEGEYFLADLIGLDVIDANTEKLYGKVEGVNTNASQVLYEVKTELGIRLLPAVDAFIKEIVPEKCIYVTPIPGLLDE
jgi:16S rRNA processing protein RimM